MAHAGPPSDIDAAVSRSLTTFGVPGAAVAYVDHGQAWSKGYGLRKLGDTAQVDARTLFPIGSNTKAFTVAGLATLVDAGKLSWSDHVEDVLPGFRLYDAYASHELTVRDLLTHRSGLGKGEGDLMIFPQTSYTRAEIVQRLRYLPPKTSFRSVFAYDNVLYIVAGSLIEHITGLRWEDFIRQRIFGPLGMTDSSPNFTEIATANRAWPHARVSGAVRGLGPVAALPAVPDIDNAGPAGSINASAADMARWLDVQLHGGRLPRGGTLFTPDRGREMWTPQVVEAVPPAAPELAAMRPDISTYALGWNVFDYHGHRVVTHGGGVYGGISAVMLVPDMQAGFVVLTNAEEHHAVDAIAYRLLDHVLGLPPTDWVAAGKTVRDRELEQASQTVRASLRTSAEAASPALSLQTYAGSYRSAWYGTVTVGVQPEGLSISFDHSAGMSGVLIHVDHDTFRTRWTDPAIENAFVTFSVGPDRSVAGAALQPVSPLADFSFDYGDLGLVRER